MFGILERKWGGALEGKGEEEKWREIIHLIWKSSFRQDQMRIDISTFSLIWEYYKRMRRIGKFIQNPPKSFLGVFFKFLYIKEFWSNEKQISMQGGGLFILKGQGPPFLSLPKSQSKPMANYWTLPMHLTYKVT